ncbi:MAG: hypothetical protein IIY02_05675 [Firmicutes bacterium]|nr:hypothetical protein [Bacillota bacterium]
MLPFFILSNIITAVGGVSLFGKVWERPVRRFLKLPGEAAFVLAAGYTSGVPVSATIIADLRKKKILTKKQGEHLLAFAANVSPGFLLSAVAVAMLAREEIGLYLAAVHYGTNFLTMSVCTLFSKKEELPPRQIVSSDVRTSLSLPKIVSDAAEKSISAMLLIGEILLIFRVLCEVIEGFGFIEILCETCCPAAAEPILTALCRGFLEITTGAESITALSDAVPFSLVLALLSAVFAFGGVSALMQIASQIRGTDLSLGFYLKYKIIQGVTAFAISLLFYDKVAEISAAVATAQTAQSTPFHADISIFPWYGFVILFFFLTLIIQRLFCEK